MTIAVTDRGPPGLVAASLRKWAALPAAFRWLAPLGIMSALWWSSSRSPQGQESNVFGALVHNGMHVLAFGGLAAALRLALHPSVGRRLPGASAVAVAIAIVYGIVDEVHQGFVPGRTSSIADVCSDATGAMLAVAWLRPVLENGIMQVRVLLLLVVACLASVCLATFGPW